MPEENQEIDVDFNDAVSDQSPPMPSAEIIDEMESEDLPEEFFTPFVNFFIAGVDSEDIRAGYEKSIKFLDELTMQPKILASYPDYPLEDQKNQSNLMFAFPFGYKINKCHLENSKDIINQFIMQNNNNTDEYDNQFVFS